ncbi:hypothetical protein WMY93_003725 [Mugilogobius chulae]|uniref:Uncharacterized protein n=1 Tax=Mugilogobius chulae TaxID=88201 RepID=A0AAW0Q0F7_9GOBI
MAWTWTSVPLLPGQSLPDEVFMSHQEEAPSKTGPTGGTEAIEIRKRGTNSINRDNGAFSCPTPAWDTLLQRTPGDRRRGQLHASWK